MKSSEEIVCSPRCMVFLVITVAMNILTIFDILLVLWDKSSDGLIVQIISVLLLSCVGIALICKYRNEKIVYCNKKIYYTNLFRKNKIFDIHELKKKVYVGRAGSKYIFKNGKFIIYQDYRNFEEITKEISECLK